MSDIKIQPSATGSATVTLTAPATNTARTITFPDSTSTLLASDGSGASLTNLPLSGYVAKSGGSNGIMTGMLTINSADTSWRGMQMIRDTDTGSSAAPYLTLWNGNETGSGNTGLMGRLGILNGDEFAVHSVVNYPMTFRVNESEKMRIDTNGRLGIGTTSPGVSLDIGDADGGSAGVTGKKLRISQDFSTTYSGTNVNTWGGITLGNNDETSNNTGTGVTFYSRSSSSGIASIQSTSAASDRADLRFITRGSDGIAERMIIDTSGNVGIGGTPGDKFDCYGPVAMFRRTASGSGYERVVAFKQTTTEVGNIKINNSSTQYATSSDYRLKENVVDMADATTRLKQLKPKRFNWIVDDTNTLVDGFLAHEVSSIVPEATSGEKDDMEDDGITIKPQGIDQSKLVPLLVKTIQELEARLTAGGL